MKDSLELAWHELNLHAVTITNSTAYSSPLPSNWLPFSAAGGAAMSGRYDRAKPTLPPKPAALSEPPQLRSPSRSPPTQHRGVRFADVGSPTAGSETGEGASEDGGLGWGRASSAGAAGSGSGVEGGAGDGSGSGTGGLGETEAVPESVRSCDTSTDGYLLQRACCKLRQQMARSGEGAGTRHHGHHGHHKHHHKYEDTIVSARLVSRPFVLHTLTS